MIICTNSKVSRSKFLEVKKSFYTKNIWKGKFVRKKFFFYVLSTLSSIHSKTCRKSHQTVILWLLFPGWKYSNCAGLFRGWKSHLKLFLKKFVECILDYLGLFKNFIKWFCWTFLRYIELYEKGSTSKMHHKWSTKRFSDKYF